MLRRLMRSTGATPFDALRRVEVHRDHVRLTLPAAHLAAIRARLEPDETVWRDPGDPSSLRLDAPFRIALRGGKTWITGGGPPSPRPDRALIGALREAQAMLRRDPRGLPVLDASPDSSYRRRLLGLAFHAPDIQRAILDGRQPPGLRLSKLMALDLPLDWAAQDAAIAQAAAA